MTTPNPTTTSRKPADRERASTMSLPILPAGPAPAAVWQGTGGELKALLRAVLVHTVREDLFEALEMVVFEVDHTTLYLVATDRHTLGIARTVVKPSPAGVRFAIAVEADALAQTARTLRSREPVTLTVTSDGVEVDRHRIRQTIPSQTVDGFPDWRRLFASLASKTPTGGEPTGFHPRFLTRFQTATCGEYVPLVIRHYGPTEATVITCGDWFAGALMPMRLHDAATEALNDWLTTCHGDQTQEAAA